MTSVVIGAALTAYVALSVASRSGLLPKYLQYLLKLSHFAICLAIASLVGTVIAIVSTLVPALREHRHSIPYVVGRVFATLATNALDITVVIDGEEHLPDNGHPGVLVANHQSSFDIVVMSCIFPRRCTVIAKKSLAHVPILGTYCMYSSL
jgi:lysophosphatidate acyltransferase